MENLNKISHIFYIGEDCKEEMTIMEVAKIIGEITFLNAISTKQRKINVDSDYFIQIVYKRGA